MVVERVGTDQRVDKPLHLGQAKGLAQRRILWPRLFKGRAHIEIAAVVGHLF